MKIYKEVLQAKLRRERLSQAKLAKLAGITPNTISGWNKGKDARRSVIEKVAKVLKCSVDDLTTSPSEANPEQSSYNFNLEVVAHHYDVSTDDVIRLAPLLFSVIAERGLDKRKKRLEDWYQAVKKAHEKTPLGITPDYLKAPESFIGHIDEIYACETQEIQNGNLKNPGRDDYDYFFEALQEIDTNNKSALIGIGGDRINVTLESFQDHFDEMAEVLNGIDEISGYPEDHGSEILSKMVEWAIRDGFALRDIPEKLWRQGQGFERAKFIASFGGKETLSEEALEFVPPQGAQDFNEVNPNGGDNA